MSETVSVLSEMAAALRAAGYLVVKVPPCERDFGHGRHSLITRSAMCEGREPIPHAPINGHFGSFGWRVICACGGDFATYDEPSEWDEHKAEHNITESFRR